MMRNIEFCKVPLGLGLVYARVISWKSPKSRPEAAACISRAIVKFHHYTRLATGPAY